MDCLRAILCWMRSPNGGGSARGHDDPRLAPSVESLEARILLDASLIVPLSQDAVAPSFDDSRGVEVAYTLPENSPRATQWQGPDEQSPVEFALPQVVSVSLAVAPDVDETAANDEHETGAAISGDLAVTSEVQNPFDEVEVLPFLGVEASHDEHDEAAGRLVESQLAANPPPVALGDSIEVLHLHLNVDGVLTPEWGDVLRVGPSDDLSGTGTINGALVNYGLVSPGNSPGIISVTDFTQADDPDGNGDGAVLLIEIAGRLGPGDNPGGHDQVQVSATATLDGTLEVELLDGFVPRVGDVFEFMTFDTVVDDFASFVGLDIGGGLYFRPVLDAEGGTYALEVVALAGGLTVAVDAPKTADEFYAYLAGKSADDFFEFDGTLNVLGHALSGHFVVESNGSGAFEIGTSDLAVDLFADGQSDLLGLTGGTVAFLLSDDAFAGSGTVAVSVLNVGGFSLGGTFPFELNATTLPVHALVNVENLPGGLEQDIDLPAGGFLRIPIDQLADGFAPLVGAGKELPGDYVFIPTVTSGGDKVIAVAVSGVNASLSDGASNLVTVSEGSGSLLLLDDGLAGTLAVTVDLGDPNIGVEAGGAFVLAFNTGAAPVNETIHVGGSVIVVNVAANFLRVEGTDVALTILGQRLSGDFIFEEDGGASRVTVALTNARMVFGDGVSELVHFTVASATMAIDADGLFGTITGTAGVNLPGITMSTAFDVEIDLRSDPFVRAEATGATLNVLGQQVTGNIVITEARDAGANTVRLDVTGATASFAGGAVTATLDDGSIIFSSAGVTGSLVATVSIAAQGVALSGALALAIDTTDPDSRYIRIGGTGVTLTVAGQELAGNFAVEAVTSVGGGTFVRIAADNVTMAFGDGTVDLVSVSAGQGTLLLGATGLAGRIEGAVTLGITGFALASADVSIEINTFLVAVDETFMVGVVPIDLVVPAGPFVRITLENAKATIAQALISGNLMFEQRVIAPVAPAVDDTILTLFALSDVALTVADQGLQNGQGAFLASSGGVAGFLTGQASIETAGVSVGGDLGVRINTTAAAVDQSVEVGGQSVDIVFAAGNVFEFFGADLSFNVGDFVTVEGNVAFSSAGDGTETFAGSDLTVFLGQGPYRLPDDTLNPAAVGVVLTGAHVAVIRFGDGTLAFEAVGTVETLGVAGVTLTGTVTVRFNNTGAAVTERIFDFGTPDAGDDIAIAFTAGEADHASFAGDDLDLTILDGFLLEGTFAFSRATTVDGDSVVTMAFSGVTLALGDDTTPLVNVSNGEGAWILTRDGLAGTASAKIDVLDPSDAGSDFGLTLNASFALNTTGRPVNQTVDVGGAAVTIALQAGPFLRVEATEVDLTVLGQTLGGDFVFEQQGTGVDQVVTVEMAAGSLVFSDGTDPLATLSDVNGQLVITADGIAGSISGAASVDLADVDFTGRFSVAIDTTDADGANHFIRASATGVTLVVAGQTLSGDFAFEETGVAPDRVVTITATNVDIAFGDGTTDFVTAHIASATLTIESAGITAAILNADVAANLPGVVLRGLVNVTIDTVAATTVFEATGTAVFLDVGGQTLGGQFTVRQTTTRGADGIADTDDDETVVGLALVGVVLDLTSDDGNTNFVHVEIALGAVMLSQAGLAAQLTGQATLDIAGVAAVAFNVTVELNTGAAAVDEHFIVNATDVPLLVPAGPFVRVAATAVTITIDTFSVVGNFLFDQASRTDEFGLARTVTRVAVTDLAVTIPGATPAEDQGIIEGSGALVILDTGVAGFVSGKAQLAVGGFSAGGTIGLRINKTGQVVDETITLAGRTLHVQFGAGEENVFEFFGAGLSLTIGDFVTIEGDVVFKDGGNGRQVFGADNALLFVGQGPLRLYEGRDEINPSATGLLISNATVGVVRIVATGGLALFAEGDVSVIGIGGVNFTGRVRVRFNNTGAAVSRTITFTAKDGSTKSAVVAFAVNPGAGVDESDMQIVRGADLDLDILGQRLAGSFVFGRTVVDGEDVIAVGFDSVTAAFGDGTNELVAVSAASGAFILTSAGLAGEATATLTVDETTGVSLTTTATLAINTTGRAITAGVTVPAGPFIRVSADDVNLVVAGQTLTGDFTFEQVVAGSASVVTVAFADVEIHLGDGTTDLVDVTGASGVFVLSAAGLAGQARAALALHAGTGVTFTAGRFALAVNTTSTAVNRNVTVGGRTTRLALPAGPFVRIDGTGVDLTIAGQTLTGDFSFRQQRTTAGRTVVTVAAAGVALAIQAGATDVLNASNGQGLFVLTAGGLAGSASADVAVNPATGVSLTGTFVIELNKTGGADNAVFLTVDVAGRAVTLNVAAGDFVRVAAIGTRLTVGGFNLSADRLVFQAGGGTVSVTGTNVGFELRAGQRRVVGLRGANFSFTLTAAGVVGSLSGAELLGPQFGGDITLSGVVALDFDTTGADDIFIVTVTGAGAGPASIGVLDSTLSADTFVFSKVGASIEVGGTNLALELKAGDNRVIGFENANFAFRFTKAGITGAVLGAVLLGPDLGADIAMTGTVSFSVNTTTRAQTLTIGADRISVPAARVGGAFVCVELTGASLTIFGNVFTAQRLVFETDGAVVDLRGTGINFVLQAGGKRVVAVNNAKFAFRFSAEGVSGALLNATVTGPDYADIALAGTVSVLVNTTTTASVLDVATTAVTVPAAPAGGYFVRVEAVDATLTVGDNGLTADRLVFQLVGQTVEVSGENLGLVLEADGTRVLGIDGADFLLRFTADGLVGAAVDAQVAGELFSDDFTLAGTISVLLNTTTDEVDLAVGGQSITVAAAPAGSLFVRIDVTNGALGVLGNELTADRFSFQVAGTVVEVSGENLGMVLRAGTRRVLALSEADFFFQFNDEGLVGAVVNATILGPDFGGNLTLSGVVTMLVNTTTLDVTVPVGGGTLVEHSPTGGAYICVELASARLGIAGVELRAAKLILEADLGGAEQVVTVSGETLTLAMGDGASDFLSVTVATGSLTIDSTGVVGSLTDVVVTAEVPDVAFGGTFNVAIDTRNPGARYVRVTGTGVSLDVAGQSVGGDFLIEQTRAQDGRQVVRVFVTNVSMVIGDPAAPFVDVTGGTGLLLFNSLGLAGRFSIAADFELPDGMSLSADVIELEINTTSVAVVESLVLLGEQVDLALPAGPFVRVTVLGGQLTIAGTVLAGDFSFDQSGAVTRIAAVAVELTYDGSGLTNGEGGFILSTGGIAGILTGDVSAAAGGFELGGSIGFRVNTTTGEVHEAIAVGGRTVAVDFGAGEFDSGSGAFFQVFGAGLSLTIGDFVTIEGDVTFSNGRFGANNVDIFLGQGPAKLEDGSLNPAATGVMLQGGQVALIKSSNGSFAMYATGTVLLVGIPDIVLTGLVTIRINTTGGVVSDAVFVPGDPAGSDVAVEFGPTETTLKSFTVGSAGAPATLAAAGQVLSGAFAFSLADMGGGQQGLAVEFQGVTLDLAGGAVSVTNGIGFLLMTSQGLAGSAAGDVTVNIPGAIEFEGTFRIALNTTSSPVSRTFTPATPAGTPGDAVAVAVPAGPYVMVEGSDVDLKFGTAIALHGSFALEAMTLDGEVMVRILATGVSMTLGDGTTAFLEVTNGQGVLLIDGDDPADPTDRSGIAGSLAASVFLNVPRAELSGDFAVAVNSTGEAFAGEFTVGTQTVTLDLPAGDFLRVEGTGVELAVMGQTLGGDFAFEKTTIGAETVVSVAIANATLALGDGTTNIVEITQGTGALLIRLGAGGTAEFAGELAATFAINVPGITLGGPVEVEFNTSEIAVQGVTFDVGVGSVTLDVEAGPFVRIVLGNDTTAAVLEVAGQSLSGIFAVEARTTSGGATVVTIGAREVEMSFTDGATELVTLTNGQGLLVLASDGLAGTMSADFDAGRSTAGFGASGSVAIEINTFATPVTQSVNVGDDVVVINVPGGPLLRISATDLAILVAGQTLMGNFHFEKTANSVAIAASNVRVTLTAGTTVLALSDGVGALVIDQYGLAGRASGIVGLTGVPGVTLAGSFAVEFNDRGGRAIDVTVGGVALAYGASDFLRVTGTAVFGLSDFVDLSGSFGFELSGSGATTVLKVGAANVTAFLGVPGAVGLSLTDATLGLVIYSNGKFAAEAFGDVELVGIGGALAISGVVALRVNTTGDDDLAETIDVGLGTVDIAFGAGEGHVQFFAGEGITLVTPVGNFVGDIFFTRDGTTREVFAGGTNIDFFVGNDRNTPDDLTDDFGVRVSGAEFALLIQSDGKFAFQATGGVQLVGIPDLTVVGDLSAEMNTSLLDVTRSFDIAGTTVTLDVAAGTSRFGADNVTLVTPLGNLTGSFAVRHTTAGPDGVPGSPDDTTELLIAAAGVEIFVGDDGGTPATGDDVGFKVSGAELAILITDAGFALEAGGAAAVVGVTGLTLGGRFGVQINTLTVDVSREITVGGVTKSLAVAADTARFGGNDVELTVAGQTLRSNITVEKTTDIATGGTLVGLAVTDVLFALGDGTTNFLEIANGAGTLVLSDAGLAGEFSGDVTVNVPGMAAGGTVSIEINQTGAVVDYEFVVDGTTYPLELDAGTYVRVLIGEAGSPAAVTIAGQTLMGVFLFEVHEEADGSKLAVVGASEVSLILGDGPTQYVTVTAGEGLFVISPQGLAGTLAADAAFQVPNVLSGDFSVAIALNTMPTAVNRTFDFGAGQAVTLDLVPGPFVRVVLEDVDVTFSVGAGFVAHGNFLFDQRTEADGRRITRLAVTDFSVEVAGNTLTEGQGGFVITDAGVAGIVSGKASLDIGPVAGGGQVTLRVNTTGGEIDETMTLAGQSVAVRFGPGEGTVFAMSVSDLSLNIGDFVTIEGNVSFVDTGAESVFAGNELEVFLGRGPPRLGDGQVNPLATGILLSNATVGLVRIGNTYALSATGTVKVLGINGVVLSGTASVRFNNTGQAVDRILAIPGSDSDVVVRFETDAAVASLQASNINVSILGQTFSGDFAFETTTLADGSFAILAAANNVTLTLGDGANALVSVTGGQGAFLLSGSGLAGQVSATVNVNLPGVDFTGSFALAINTTGLPVAETVTVDGEDVALALQAGPFVRIDGVGVTLNVLGQSLSGNFFFERMTGAGGASLIRLGASEVTLSLGGGVVTVTEGTGTFLVTSAGLAGRLSGHVGVNVTGVTFGAGFTIALNTTGSPIAETFTIAGESVTLDLPGGPFLRVEATGITLDVLGQTLSGDFAFEQSLDRDGQPLVRVAAANVSIALGDGTTDFVTVSNGSGSFLIDTLGLAGQLSATVAVNVPGVTVSGNLMLQLNQRSAAVDEAFDVGDSQVILALPAGPFLRIASTNVSVDLLGQTIEGNFFFEQRTTNAGEQIIRVGATDVAASLGGGLVTVSGGTALFAIDSAGLAGRFSGAVTLDVPNVVFAGNFTVEVNTTGAAVDYAFHPWLASERLTLDAGQYVRVVGTGLTLDVLGQSIKGNFLLEASTTVDGGPVVKVAIFSASMRIGPQFTPYINIPDADGGFIISRQGVAASLTVNNATFSIPGLDGAGMTFDSALIEFNSMSAPVVETFVIQDAAGADLAVALDLPGGPFVRVVVLGVAVDFLVGGARFRVGGDFMFDQMTDAGGQTVTRIAAAGVEIDLAAQGLGEGQLANGQGGFIISSTGVAGVLSGEASLGVGPVAAGGTIIVRINTTGQAVDQSIVLGAREIAIRFGATEGRVFAVSVSDLTLSIGDFVTIEGNVSFLDQGDRATFAGDDLEIFLGHGPARLEGGDLNPLAVGVLLTDARIGVIKFSGVETTWALYAEGTVMLLGVDGITLLGTAVVRVNTTGGAIDETLTIAGSAGDGVAILFDTADEVMQFEALNAQLSILGQTLIGNFSFSKTTTAAGASAIRIAMAGVSLDLAGGTVSVTGASGALLFAGSGLAGQLSGTVGVAIEGVTFAGTFGVEINTTRAAISEEFTVGSQVIAMNLPAGPFLRIMGRGVSLNILGQTLSGDFALEVVTTLAGQTTVMIAATNVSLSINAGDTPVVSLTGGRGILLVTSLGLAGEMSGTVDINVPGGGVDFTGTFSLALNTTNQAVNAQITVADELVTLALPHGPYLRVQGTGVALSIAGQTLSGGFVFEQTTTGGLAPTPVIRVAATNVELHLGGGAVNLTGGQGVLFITSAGLAASLGGTVSIDIPGVSFAGDFSIAINSSATAVDQTIMVGAVPVSLVLPAGPYLRIAGTDIRLDVMGQSLAGDFTIEQSTNATGQSVIIIGVANGSLSLGGAVPVVNVSAVEGSLLVVNGGVAGSLAANVALNLAGISLAGDFELQLNTITQPVNASVTVGGNPVALDLPAGRYLRVAGSGVSLTVFGQTLEGNFAFEQATNALARIFHESVNGVGMTVAGGLGQ